MTFAKNKNKNEKPIAQERVGYYERRTQRWRNRVWGLLLVITLLFWGQLLLRSAYFSVQGMHVNGLGVTLEQNSRDRVQRYLNGTRWIVFSRSNIFFVHADDLSDFLKEDPRIAQVDVTKDYRTRMLSVSIEERVPTYVLHADNGAFVVDQYGNLLNMPDPADSQMFVSLFENQPRSLTTNEAAFQDDFFWRVREIEKRIAPMTQLQEVRRGVPSPDAFSATTAEGWQIYFSNQEAIDSQLIRLETLLKEQLRKENRGGIAYIDLRFGDRVFYK